ncbi:hypothetical protein EON65_19930 [archaeon]|nr:MAG: hypothetical protein EON65_19930 [archaeon]
MMDAISMVSLYFAIFLPPTLYIPCFVAALIDIRKQEEVLQESYMMVPDSKNRLEQAKGELESLLVRLLAPTECNILFMFCM